MADEHVMEGTNINSIIDLENVCIKDVIRSNLFFVDEQDCLGFSIGNDRSIYLATPLK